MAIVYNCAIKNLGGVIGTQLQSGNFYVSWWNYSQGIWYATAVQTSLSSGVLASFARDLGYTDVNSRSFSLSYRRTIDSENSFQPRWSTTEEYGDGSLQHNIFGFSLTQQTPSPLVDLYLTPLQAIKIKFSAVSPGDNVVSQQEHVITLENTEDLRLRTLVDINNFWNSLGFNVSIGEQTDLHPTILCDEIDSDSGDIVTTSEIVFEDDFQTSTITHIINPAGAAGGDTLPEVAEQVEENEGDIFVLNNEVDDLQAGIYQLRRDNVDQDAYWEEVYVRVRDFSGRVRDEVSGLQAQVDFINNHQVGALNNNVQRAQEVASQANDGIVGLTFQLRDLMSRIEALENQ